MRTIIAGSRDFTDPTLVHAAIAASGFTITHVLSGGARGIDLAGEAWAAAHEVPVTVLPAEWDRFGKGAGYRRNEALAAQAEALIVCWDGRSPGTAHMVDIATRRGLQVFVFCPESHPLLLDAAQLTAGRAAIAHFNALHTAAWRAKEAWEHALVQAGPDDQVSSYALARAQTALDRYRPTLLRLYAGAAAAARALDQPWPAPAGATAPTPDAAPSAA